MHAAVVTKIVEKFREIRGKIRNNGRKYMYFKNPYAIVATKFWKVRL